MPITHEEAHKLIQFNADEILKGVEKKLLEAHLDSCESCRIYAGSIQELESTLMPVMQRRWNQHPLPQSKRLAVYTIDRTKNHASRRRYSTHPDAFAAIHENNGDGAAV
jgi:predicted anti-sigma-YlaC factor YlaD